jgi:hypothetical protein
MKISNYQTQSGYRQSSGQALRQSSGQALVALLIFVMMAVTVVSAAVAMISSNSLAVSNAQAGVIARQMADSGIETAYLGIIRQNDSYTGETLNLNEGTVVITVTGGSTKTITSRATVGNFVKTVESIAMYGDNELTQVSWKEVE